MAPSTRVIDSIDRTGHRRHTHTLSDQRCTHGVRMIRLAFLMLMAVLAGWVYPAGAELHEGSGYILLGDEGGWDFSAFSYVGNADADMFFRVVLLSSPANDMPLTRFLSGSGLQFAPEGVEFDSLAVAPDSGYVDTVEALQWRSYFVRTHEGHYVKIQLETFDGFTQDFRYVYQDDASTALPVHPATWGGVKALYRDSK